MRLKIVSPGIQDPSHSKNATLAGVNLTEDEDATVNACRKSCCCFLDLKICRPVYLAALSRLVDEEQRKEL